MMIDRNVSRLTLYKNQKPRRKIVEGQNLIRDVGSVGQIWIDANNKRR